MHQAVDSKKPKSELKKVDLRSSPEYSTVMTDGKYEKRSRVQKDSGRCPRHIQQKFQKGGNEGKGRDEISKKIKAGSSKTDEQDDFLNTGSTCPRRINKN